MSLQKTGKKYGISNTTVQKILIKNGVPRRSLSEARRNVTKSLIDENVFDSIDSRDKCYWLGVMYSDGYISKTNKYTHFFGLTAKASDIEWIEKFRKFLKSNANIGIYKVAAGYNLNSTYARLLIGNNKIVSDLERNGVLEHKSLKELHVPCVPYIDDFVRGYIDGNGSINKETGVIIISGGYTFLNELQEAINVQGKLYKDKSIYGLHFNYGESRKLCNRLYSNANYYLNRKYVLASKYFNSPIT